MSKPRKANKSAFTLIELIIVIAIISILAAAVFVAVDPPRRLNEARNARRWSDISTILEAIKKDQTDQAVLRTEISGLTDDSVYTIAVDGQLTECTAAVATCTDGLAYGANDDPDVVADTINASCADLSTLPANYLFETPNDPVDADANESAYYIVDNGDGTVTVGACEADGEGAGGTGTAPVIQLTR